jgi:photosystem II stability/assembly factor-like uncharacterized protein
VLYAAVLEARNYVVGADNAPSGLYRLDGPGAWTHLGWVNVRAFGLAADPFDARTLALAGGNGVLVSRDAGASWRVTTDWTVTEVLHVAFCPHTPGTLLAATAYGLWRSTDGAATWLPLRTDGAPDETFSTRIVPDPAASGRWLVGTEAGVRVSDDGGATWRPVGPAVPIRDLRAGAAGWLAGTEDHGVLHAADGADAWTTLLPDATVYAVCADPERPAHLAAGGYATGLLRSDDGGSMWRRDPLPDPVEHIAALAFAPDGSGRLWVGTVNEGAYVSDAPGAPLRAAGLDEATVTSFASTP